jgi:hypothetical protein
MMLGHPGAVEAEPLGMNDLLGHQPVAGRGIGLVKKAAEETQPLWLSRIES